MLKIVLALALLAIVPAWSAQYQVQDSSSAGSGVKLPYALYKAYPQSANDVQFLRQLALSSASSQMPTIFLTPIGQGKTSYILVPANTHQEIIGKLQRQHIPNRKVEAVNIKNAQFDNEFHKAKEFPPKRPGQALQEGPSGSNGLYVISSPRITQWGAWGDWAQCPQGQYAVGMRLKTERNQGSGDDSALNAIQLICATPDKRDFYTIKSLEGEFGDWGQTFYCPAESQVVGFELRSEENQYGGDDSAANNLRLFCNSQYDQMIEGDGETWGSWTGQRRCLPNQAVVGFRTQVEGNQGGGDDSALNNVDMECVDLRK